jgi:hypothetical protein
MRRTPEDRSIVPFPTHAVSNMPSGQSSVSINLGSRVYLAPIFGGTTCPQCVGGFCDGDRPSRTCAAHRLARRAA